jgi:hypothetical protein
MATLAAVELAEMAELDTTTAAPSPSQLVPAGERAASPFAPLFTQGTEPYGLAELDELGRPLAGVYVPDALLL